MSWTEKEFISYLIFHKVSRWQNMIRDKKLLQGKAAFLKNLIARTTTSPSVVSRGKGGTERRKGQKTSRKVNVTINLRGYLNRKKLCWLPHIRKCEAIQLRWPLERGLKIYSYHIGKATHSWIVLSKMHLSVFWPPKTRWEKSRHFFTCSAMNTIFSARFVMDTKYSTS